MSIFSKLFRSPEKRQVDRILDESRRNADRILKPLAALGKAIFIASEKCRDGVKPWIVASDGKDFQRKKDFAFYEFVYFFTHMTMRYAFTALTETEKEHLGKHLIRMVASLLADGTFESPPDDLRKRMVGEFCTNIQKAEIEYATCAPGDIFSGSEAEQRRNWGALSTAIGENVAMVIGCQSDNEVKSRIAVLALEQFGHLNLLNLVLDYKRDSLGLPDNY